MGLSPEERRQIYEEEKAQIEAEEKAKPEAPKTETVSLNLEPNVAGLLCYVLGWVSGVVFLVLEQKSRFVRFHAIQSIIVFGILSVAGSILGPMPVVGVIFAPIIGILAFILWILLMVRAYQNKLYKLPLAGDLAEKFSASTPAEGDNAEKKTSQR